MNFLAPGLLVAGAAVAAPIVVHLLNKFRVREVRWAAMRFLAEAVKRNQSRLRLQDLLLLLLRCAVIALLVLAFARPTFETPKLVTADAGEPLTVMVLLDQSASMGASDGVTTRFDQARDAALAFLEHLASGSATGLLLVHDGFDSPVGRPSRDIARVRRSVELARLTDRGTDFQPALQAAVDALAQLPGQREIHLFTDNQTSAWTEQPRIRALISSHPDIAFELVNVGPAAGAPPPANLAVTDLRLDAALPVAGQPLRVLAQVSNFGPAPVSGARLTLAIDDQAPSADAVIDHLAPGGSRFVPLVVRLPTNGFHALTATLPPDALAADNQRAAVVEVAPPREVLVVESRTGPAPWQGSGYFLAAALTPVPVAERDRYYLHVVRTTSALIDPASLSRYAAVFLVDAEPLSPAATSALSDAVQAGTGLVVMPGDAAGFGAFAGPPWTTLLPATLAPSTATATGLASPPYEAAMLSLWNDRAAGTLAAVLLTKAVPLHPAPAAQVWLKQADGAPAIVAHRVGRGEVVMFSAPPVPTWTNLPLHPAFLPLMHRLLAVVARVTAQPLNLAPGEVFQAALPIDQLNRDVFVRGAANDATPIAVGRTEFVDNEAMLRIRETTTVGLHTVFVGQTQQPDRLFAVQLPVAESDLAAPAAPGFGDATAAGDAAPANVIVPSATDTAHLPSAAQLWTALIIGATALSFAELVLALRASRTA